MKKLYTLALGLLAALGVQAQVTIGSTNYTSLTEALNAAQENDVITINQDIEIGTRIDKNVKNLTIQGATPEITIKRQWGKNIIMILGNANNRGLIIKNLTIDASSFACGNSIIESNNGQVTLSNVTIKDANQTGNNIITQKGGGWLVAENVNIVNAQKSENVYDIFSGNNNALTVKGSGDFAISLQSTWAMNAENYTGKSVLYVGTYAAGNTVVNGGALANFSLGNAPEGYTLINNNGNLVLNYEVEVAKNEDTGATYTSFTTALNEAQSNETITVLEDVEIPSRIGLGNKHITIQGANPLVTLKYTNTNTGQNQFVFENNNNYILTLKGLKLDVNDKCQNNNVFNCKGRLVLDNVVIANAANCGNLIQMRTDGRQLTLNNVKLENCGEKNFAVLANNNTVYYNGSNNIGAQFAQGCVAEVVEGGELTNTEAINLSFADTYVPSADAVVVKNCTDASKFAVALTGWHLESKDGNLVLSDGTSTGIDGIVADENAPVEYYNLQGIRVENPENGIFIRRQGNKTTKVAL